MKIKWVGCLWIALGLLAACSENVPGMTGDGVTVCPPGDAACTQSGTAGLGGTAGTTLVPSGGTAGRPGPMMTAGTGGGAAPVQPQPSALPCNVQEIVASRCQSCHGATPIGGAPTSLVTHADFTRDYTVVTTAPLAGRTMKTYEIVKVRINREMDTSPMPQGMPLAEAELAVLNDWIAAGAPAAAGGTTCGDGAAGAGAAGMDGSAGAAGGGTGEWMPPQPGETCYELPNHGAQTPGDTSPYMIQPGENYEQFYFKVPWTTEARGTRFGIRFDNEQVLHHWLLYTSSKPASLDGTHETVIGTVLGDAGATLLAGWAVGGQAQLAMPENVEFELPPPGSLLNAQWHFWNSTDAPQGDRSAILICTVPPGTRENVATVTWLGTEDFNGPIGMPPGFRGDFNGTCLNDSDGPIHIFDVTPHMHQLGRHMRATVIRAGSTTEEEVFDEVFDFNYQINYAVDITLMPGDSIKTYCTFHNTTDGSVAFGPSSTQEMCYLFANSYPAGALANGVLSLAGATNTCW